MYWLDSRVCLTGWRNKIPLGLFTPIHSVWSPYTPFPQQPALLYSPQHLPTLIITVGSVCAPNDFSLFRQLQRDAQAAGGYRPHCGRLRQAEEGWGAELLGALSVSCGEDAFVFGACYAAVLSLLRLRRVGGCLCFYSEGGEHYFPRGCPVAGAEAGRADAEGQLFQSGGGSRRSGSHGAARRACAGCGVFSGMSAEA